MIFFILHSSFFISSQFLVFICFCRLPINIYYVCLPIVWLSVELQPTLPICESSYSKNDEFFLFSSIMEATMIDKKLNDKSIYFELSIGNAGNSIDGHNESQCNNVGEDGELDTVDATSFNSTTNACKPISNDKFHYYLPYWDYKPCMNVRCLFPDLRRRMYNSNMISKFVEALVSSFYTSMRVHFY